MNVFIIIFILILLLGCSSSNLNRDIYNALIQRDCVIKTGEPNCGSGHPSYEDYQRERKDIENKE